MADKGELHAGASSAADNYWCGQTRKDRKRSDCERGDMRAGGVLLLLADGRESGFLSYHSAVW